MSEDQGGIKMIFAASFLRRFIAPAIIAVSVLGSSLALGQTTAQENNAAPCHSEKAYRFRDLVMPLWFGELTNAVEWRACSRVLDPSAPEKRLCISKFYDGHVTADYMQATNSRLYDQGCQLVRQLPSVNLDDLEKRATVSTIEITDRPETLKHVAGHLTRLNVSLQLPNVMVVDYPTYEFELRTQYGSSLIVRLENAPTKDALVTWIKESMATVTKRRTDSQSK